MINIENLYFHYDERQVLHDISVQLPQGSITGLIGPNGAGKSTLMRCMAGLENPSSGKVLLDGQPVLENPRESYAKLGYLPDIFGLPQNLTVLECLTYAASSRGAPEKNLSEILSETCSTFGFWRISLVVLSVNFARAKATRRYWAGHYSQAEIFIVG